MTPQQIADVQNSFKAVIPISEQAGALFYGRLFEIAPSVRPLFKGDVQEQARKLMLTLATVVKGLGRLETICPPFRPLLCAMSPTTRSRSTTRWWAKP